MQYRKEWDGGPVCKHFMGPKVFEFTLRSAVEMGQITPEQAADAEMAGKWGITVRGVLNAYYLETIHE